MYTYLRTSTSPKLRSTLTASLYPYFTMIAISHAMDSNAVQKVVYMPFYKGIATDHRAVFIDIDANYLFTNAYQDTNKQIFCRFMTDQPKKTDKYLKMLEEELEKLRIFRKVDQLKADIDMYLTEGGGDEELIKKRCINLAGKTSQLMKYSKRQVGRKHYNGGFPSSPKLKEAAREVIRVKKLLRYVSVNMVEEKHSIEVLKKELKEKYAQLRKVQKISKELRQQHLEDLAIKWSKQWNMTANQAIIIIKDAEDSKAMHKKHKRYMKPEQGGVINHLYVPDPCSNWSPSETDITNVKCQTKVTDQQSIFDILLRQNFCQLIKSKESPFMTGDLHKMIQGRDRANVVDKLLEGVHKDLDQVMSEKDRQPMLLKFIKALQ